MSTATDEGSDDMDQEHPIDRSPSGSTDATVPIAGIVVASIVVTAALGLTLSSEAFMEAQAAMFRAMAVMAEVCRIQISQASKGA